MPKIIIRGEHDPIIVPEEEANAILEKKNDPKFKGMIDVDGRQVSKASIKEIRFTDDRKKDYEPDQVREFEKQFRAMEDMQKSYPLDFYGIPITDQHRFPGIVVNPVLGGVHWSIVQHALEQHYVSRKSEGIWAICGRKNEKNETVTTEFSEFEKRIKAVRELQSKREFAQKIHVEVPSDFLSVRRVEAEEAVDDLPF